MENKSQTIRLEDAYAIYVLNLKAQRAKPRTIEFYDLHLPRFFEYVEVERVDGLTSIDIRKYLAARDNEGISPHYLHACARAVRAFLNFCVDEGWVEISPFKSVKMPRLPKEIKPSLVADDIKKLLSASVSPRDTALIYFLLDTGIRASEFVALNVEHLELAQGIVHIRTAKFDKDRDCFIGVRTVRAMLKYFAYRGNPADYEPLFAARRLDHNERLTTSGLRQWLERLGKRASVKHCNPHTFRRTFAIESLRNGMNIYVLARLMGHSDITVLRHYLHIVDDDLQEAHSKHGVVDNL